jgi:hypothetical protein
VTVFVYVNIFVLHSVQLRHEGSLILLQSLSGKIAINTVVFRRTKRLKCMLNNEYLLLKLLVFSNHKKEIFSIFLQYVNVIRMRAKMN